MQPQERPERRVVRPATGRQDGHAPAPRAARAEEPRPDYHAAPRGSAFYAEQRRKGVRFGLLGGVVVACLVVAVLLVGLALRQERWESPAGIAPTASPADE